MTTLNTSKCISTPRIESESSQSIGEVEGRKKMIQISQREAKK